MASTDIVRHTSAHRAGRAGRWKARVTAAAVLLAGLAPLVAAPPAHAVSGSTPWAVLLCQTSDHRETPFPKSYYDQLFGTAGKGMGGMLDYFHTVSYNTVDLSGTKVKDWFPVNTTRAAWQSIPGGNGARLPKVTMCADQAAKDGFDFTGYQGVIAIQNKQALTTTLAAAVAPGDTTLKVAPGAEAPRIGASGTIGGDVFGVTAVAGSTWTVTRSVNPAPASHAAGAAVVYDVTDAGAGSTGKTPLVLNGKTFNLGVVLLSAPDPIEFIAHEMGHGFGLDHSRNIKTPTEHYKDCWDIMSSFTCVKRFRSPTFPAPPGNQVGAGITSLLLDKLGWLSPARKRALSTGACNQQVVTMAALNRPDASGPMELRSPISVPGPTPGTHYAVEFRHKSGFDSGLATDAVLVHMLGADGLSYVITDTDTSGMQPGSTFSDGPNKLFLGINGINHPAGQATVTVGACALATSVTLESPGQGTYRQTVRLATTLSSGTGAPVPNKVVAFSIGNQTCFAGTDAGGRAGCSIQLDQPSGAYTATAAYNGDGAWRQSSASAPFTVLAAPTSLSYSGDVGVANGEPALLAGRLTTPPGDAVDGRPVVFAMGTGATAQSCTGTTGADGAASCPIITNQPSGAKTVALSARFAGDPYFLPSSAAAVAKVLQMEGSAQAFAGRIGGMIPLGIQSSATPDVSTAGPSDVQVANASVSGLGLSATGLSASVRTALGPNRAVSQASAAEVRLSVLGIPAIVIRGVEASSTSTCAATAGTTTIAYLAVGPTVLIDGPTQVAPNTRVPLPAGGSLVLNEQAPVAGVDRGLTVNAVHVSVLGLVDIVVDKVRSDVVNCP